MNESQWLVRPPGKPLVAFSGPRLPLPGYQAMHQCVLLLFICVVVVVVVVAVVVYSLKS